MHIDPFTGETYQGRIVKADCDGCGAQTTYEEEAYGQNFLVLCSTCNPPRPDKLTPPVPVECAVGIFNRRMVAKHGSR